MNINIKFSINRLTPLEYIGNFISLSRAGLKAGQTGHLLRDPTHKAPHILRE